MTGLQGGLWAGFEAGSTGYADEADSAWWAEGLGHQRKHGRVMCHIASGDQFYTPDSARFYWNDLPGEKHLRYVPNSDHGFGTATALANALENLLAWYDTVLFDIPRAAVSWSLDQTGRLVVTTSPPALFARLWQATNPKARDFRLQSIGEAWTSTLRLSLNGTFVVQVPPPKSGWTAYFVEVIYFVGLPQFYTTQVFITPDVLPFPNMSLAQATVCPE